MLASSLINEGSHHNKKYIWYGYSSVHFFIYYLSISGRQGLRADKHLNW